MSLDSHLYALSAETGEEQWRFKAEGDVFSSPVIAGGVIYFGSTSWTPRIATHLKAGIGN